MTDQTPAEPQALRQAAKRLAVEARRFLAFDMAGTPSTADSQTLLFARIEDVENELATRESAGAGLDVDGQKWRDAEAEGHVVTFTETGYGLIHPPSCRPDLIGCWFNTYLASRGYPEEEPGRYQMTRHKGHAEYARLAATHHPVADVDA